ncbi:MAG: glycosyltransferase [Planctomycetaceae bacterium]
MPSIMHSAAQPAARHRHGLLVLGMHRSGTSALGRVLGLLGADLPSQTIGPDEHNESGYWEAPALFRLHDQMLARADSRWDDWRPFSPTALDPYDRLGIEHALLEFLRHEFRESVLFAIKDPRICRFVPLWLDVLATFPAAPGAIIAVRHPLAVARSLQTRDGFSFAKSCLVWLRHVIDAEHSTRHVPRAFVDYDGLLADWRPHVDRIASQLGIAWPKPLPEVADAVDGFLTAQLRHHVATASELEASPHAVSWIRRAYAAVQAFVQAGDHEAAREEMDLVRSEFDNACLAFGDLWREERSNVARETLAPFGVVTNQALERHARQLQRRIASLDATIHETTARWEADEVQSSTAPGTHGQQVLEHGRHRDALGDAFVARTDGHRANLRQLVDDQATTLSRLQCSLDGAVARLDAIAARSFQTSFVTTTKKRVVDHLKKSGRKCGRLAHKAWDGVAWMCRLRPLENFLARRRLYRTVRTIRASGLFATSWYLRENADVASTGIDPIVHYLVSGAREGRCPNPLFHTQWYLDANPDVRATTVNPLVHYLLFGAAEGRDPGPSFQTAAWVAEHPELRATKCNPLAHYLASRGASPHDGNSIADGDRFTAPVLTLRVPPPATGPDASGAEDGEPGADDCSYAPLMSVIVPVYGTPAGLLQRMIDSVRQQAYGNWELCLVDDASPQPHVRPILERAAAGDPRIRVVFRDSNGNISAATNTGIEMARGEFIAFLDHDDELTADALLAVVRALNDAPDTDVVYTDQDKIDLAGRRSEPFHKPAWSPAYFESVMYVGHLLVVRASLLRETGGCDSTFDGVQDFELMLRLGEVTRKIVHLPRILYHWRKIPGSIASDSSAKRGIDELQRKAVQAHLDRLRIKAVATAGRSAHRVRVVPAPRSREPLVSILIPSRDHPELIGPCLESLFGKTSYKAFEVVVGDNETTDPDALRILARHPVTRVPLPGKFHFAAFNNRMAAQARGEYLLLLNNDTEVVQPNWLDTMLLYAEQDDVGAVGPLLLYDDGTVQHAGVILGPRGTADHVMRGFPGDADGYAGSLQAARDVTAVTGACLLVRRDRYMACGGLNETYGRHYEDVDLCLRLRRLGLRNIFVGGARMLHHESKSRGSYYDFTDRVLLLDHWETWIRRGDPYYNAAFDPERIDYSLRAA